MLSKPDALAEYLGLAFIPKGAGYECIKKERQNCKHRDTDHCGHCDDPANVPCGKWGYDGTVKCTPDLTKCSNCSGTYAVTVSRCPHCRYVPNDGITDNLVRCDRTGEHTACAPCGHSSPHVSLNGCATEAYDFCKHIDRSVKCKPIKEVTKHA